MARIRVPLARHTKAPNGVLYLRFRVPEKVREAFGGQEQIWRTTGQSDEAAAAIAALADLTKLKQRVARARAYLKDGTGLAGMAAEWRKIKDDGSKTVDTLALDLQGSMVAPADENDTRGMASEWATRDEAVKAAAARFVPGGYRAVQRAIALDDDEANSKYGGDEGAAVVALGGPQAEQFLKIAVGGQKPTSTFIAPWHSQRTKEVEARNAKMDRSDVAGFAKDHTTLDTINKRAVVAWVARLREKDASRERGGEPLSPATIRRKLAALRSFWRHLQALGLVSDEMHPFTGIEVRERQKEAAKRTREAFTPAEVAALYTAAKENKDDVLADLIRLAAFTGARREELCGLTVKDVADDVLKIGDAKTSAGNRTVPLHDSIKGTVERLVKEAQKRGDEWLLNIEAENQYNGRGAGPGKRFGRLARKLGHPPTKVFHSIRRTCVSMLDDAGVQPHVIAALVGHERKDFTGSRYSDAELRGLVRDAVQKLQYPAPL